MEQDTIEAIGARLRDAERTLQPIEPFADELGEANITAAYAVQRHNVGRWRAEGRTVVGRKIGLTSKAVQQQLGVDQPDYGTLFSDTSIDSGGTVKMEQLIAPRVEGEIALVLARDISDANVSLDALSQAIDYVLPALEIVDSRIQDWRIGIVDAISNNGASSRFVLGTEPKPLNEIDLVKCEMNLLRNGEIVSVGTGADCLGHPLHAALWLAKILVEHDEPLQAGDIVLTGALGPMVKATAGDFFEGRISEFSAVQLNFG